MGTGPFKFVRWEPNQEIVLEANDRYYEGRPFLDTVVFKIDGSSEETFAEFLQGNLEETIIPGGMTDEVRADPKYRQYQRVRISTSASPTSDLTRSVNPSTIGLYARRSTMR